MAGGQMLDLAAEAGNLEENAIRQMQAMKTGALITACCQMGATLGGASPSPAYRYSTQVFQSLNRYVLCIPDRPSSENRGGLPLALSLASTTFKRRNR